MNRKFFWVIGGAVLVILLIIFLFKTISAPKPSTNSSAVLGAPVTVTGMISCLPKKNSGNECVVGIEDKNGRYYALLGATGKQIDPAAVTTGSQITVSGNLVTNSNLPKNYNAYGVVQVVQ
jgi:hypothetical protein